MLPDTQLYILMACKIGSAVHIVFKKLHNHFILLHLFCKKMHSTKFKVAETGKNLIMPHRF